MLVVKKRKFVSAVDPSQHKMDRFLSSSSLERKDDPMVVDSPTVVPDLKEKSNVLGTVRQQSLTPCIVIANAKRNYLCLSIHTHKHTLIFFSCYFF